MEENKNIKKYTAADIEKYWKGQLSETEMHAIEKAALDDPFLADALEGYKNSSTAAEDITLLKQKINERIGVSSKHIPLGSRRFLWLRVAATIIILAGAGIFASQYFFNNKKDLTVNNKSPKNIPEEKSLISKQEPGADSNGNIHSDSVIESQKVNPVSQKDALKNPVSVNPIKSDTIILNDLATNPSNARTFKASEPVSAPEYKSSEVEKAEVNAGLANAAKDKEAVLNDDIGKKAITSSNKKQMPAQRVSAMPGYISYNNKFTGRVVDTQNNAVPFANVTNTRDRVGTYTDIRGNFNLVSADSVLEVQIRSLGYETKNYRLLPAKKDTNLVMQEDLDARTGILNNSNKKVVTNLAREENRVFEEPEPEVGWSNYDTYVANNLNIPDEALGRNNAAEIELSFEVDKKGQPVNIKVTRSSQCRECDAEAIRLLKEGPKWKRRGKKSKTTVTVTMDK